MSSMSDPFDVLGLPRNASDAEIRAGYLKLVRQFPPDRAPERFAEIRAAYDELRDPIGRLETQILSLKSRDSLEAIQADLRGRLRDVRLPVEALLRLAETP